MEDIHLCPACGGCGLNMQHPKIHDIPAGKYKDEHTCPICKGSGYDPRKHPDRIAAHVNGETK